MSRHPNLPPFSSAIAAARRLALFFVSVAMVCVFAGCGGGKSSPSDGFEGTPVSLRHASLLTMMRGEDFVVCDVQNPWQTGGRLRRYVLVPRDAPLPRRLPEGTLLRTPLRRAVAFSCIHAALAADLGAAERVCGLCDARYALLPATKARLRTGQWADMGTSQQPDLERIAASGADALLVSPYADASYGGVEKLGIPLVECADYMESSPLARAEWMKFYGLLFGCEARADSLFAAVERRYLDLRRHLVRPGGCRPTLLADRLTGGTWYVPGGRSTTGRLYADAGARYLFADLKESGSVARSFEQVLERAAAADLWLIKYGAPADITYASLRADYVPYAHFRAWQRRRIYGCNVLRRPFFETLSFRPDLLLREVGAIVRPDRLPGVRPEWFEPLR